VRSRARAPIQVVALPGIGVDRRQHCLVCRIKTSRILADSCSVRSSEALTARRCDGDRDVNRYPADRPISYAAPPGGRRDRRATERRPRGNKRQRAACAASSGQRPTSWQEFHSRPAGYLLLKDTARDRSILADRRVRSGIRASIGSASLYYAGGRPFSSIVLESSHRRAAGSNNDVCESLFTGLNLETMSRRSVRRFYAVHGYSYASRCEAVSARLSKYSNWASSSFDLRTW
jgi:hypothetical protein